MNEVEAEADTGAGMGGGGEGAAAAGGNNHNSNNNNAFNPFGGMPNGGIIAGMNITQPGQQPSPEQMLSMMNSPMMQSLLDNPTMVIPRMMQSLLDNPTVMRQVLQMSIESNPQLQQVINSLATYSTNDAEGERRRIVEQCMPHVPHIIMNNEEWYNLLNVLYKLGILSEYLADLDSYENVEVEFNNYFDINSEHCVKIDPTTLRITHLGLDMIYDVANNRVPSIIDQFQSLESIDLENCGLLTKELGNLSVLKTITFCACTTDMFENVPEGLQLSSIKAVIINSASSTRFKSNLSSFLKIFPNTLEQLSFCYMTREDSDEILHVLQNDDVCFRHSLTTIKMSWCQLNEDDLKLLLFDILERFPNLHTLDIGGNIIESLSGIGDRIKYRIKHGPLISDNKLRKLNLSNNPIMLQICGDGIFFVVGVVDDDDDDDAELSSLLDDESEDGGGETEDALVALLDTFNGISNVCANASDYQDYEPKIEYKLRINLAGRKELMDRPIMNRALWPLILERAYSNSSEIYMYDRNGRNTVTINQEVESKKCASGLFYLLTEWKILDGSSTTTNITNDNSSEGSNINNNNNTRNE